MKKQDPEKQDTLATRLREARDLAGLSQGQVARLLGFHRPTISQIEAAQRRVSTDELKRFDELYDVSTSWLLDQSSTALEPNDPRVQLAARELNKLKPVDLDRLLKVIAAMRDAPDTSDTDDR